MLSIVFQLKNFSRLTFPIYLLSPQLRTHSQKEKLLQMTYSRQAPYPFDFFFERSPQQQQQQQQVEEEEEEEEEEGDTASSGSDSGATLH